MQERVNEKTVAIAVQATKMTGRLLARIGEMYLRHVREKQRDHKMAKSRDPSTFKQNQAGKIKIKTLMREGDGVSNVEIKDDSIKVFERLARKNGIRYAVKKDKTTQPPTLDMRDILTGIAVGAGLRLAVYLNMQVHVRGDVRTLWDQTIMQDIL